MATRRIRLATVFAAAAFAAAAVAALAAVTMEPTPAVTLTAQARAAVFGRIDHSAFALDAGDTFGRYGSAISQLEADPRVRKVSLEAVVTTASPGRKGTSSLCHKTNLQKKYRPSGFCWDHDDDVTYGWVPQGVTGSGDADPSGLVGGRRLVAASWHSNEGGGHQDAFARVSIAEPASRGTPYHHLLLVEPYVAGGRVNFRPPANVHADGLMWYGDKLFVATGVRLQVYSLRHIWKTQTSGGEAGRVGLACEAAYARRHAWALPMIGEYRTVRRPDGSWASCTPVKAAAPCMNSISLAPSRDSFVTAEYYRPDKAGGRVIRWPLDKATGLPRSAAGTKARATEAFRSPIWHMQGAATDGTAFYLTGACPGPNAAECIHKAVPGQPPHVLTKAPPLTENLSYWPKTDELWGINEPFAGKTRGKRVVFKIDPHP